MTEDFQASLEYDFQTSLEYDFQTSLEFARSLDDADELRHFRDRFSIPEDRDGRRNIYVCGNSLGLRPDSAVRRARVAAPHSTRRWLFSPPS